MENVTPDKIRAIANRIRLASEEYARLAARMEEAELPSIRVNGFATLENATLSRLESPIGSARRAIAKQIMEAEAQSDVAELEERILSKKSKG